MARVLIVDDDPDIRHVAARVLRRGHHAVSVAEGATQALAFFEHASCDLIFCDRMMPSMSGLQLLTTIRKRKMSQPRFVIVSASGRRGDIEEAMRLGADGYLVKPFEPRELLAEVERLVGQC